MRACVWVALVAGAAVSSAAMAQFSETEDNNTKAAANIIGPVVPGSTLTGTSTGTSTTTAGIASADYFRLDFGGGPLGIYRWTAELTSQTAGHTASIRGLSQTGAAAAPWMPGMQVGTPQAGTDAAPQSSLTVGTTRVNAWYSFGRPHSMYYRVTGTTSTTAPYTATFSSSLVTPLNAGTFQPGAITINSNGQGHSSDTDFWVYDSNFNAIVGYGNDDASTNSGGSVTSGSQAFMIRDFAPGVYYLAISNFNLANNQASPSDDNFRTGTILDFPDMALNSSTLTNVNVTFTISDAFGNSVQTAATKVAAFDIVWAQFTVVPAPGAAALLGLGGLVAARRRRN